MSTFNSFVNVINSYQRGIPGLIGRQNAKPLGKGHEKRFIVTTVGKVLDTIQPLPSSSILLGRCMDGLPFFMTLSDPEIGAVLIGGDRGCGKTHHLQVMVDSAVRMNAPRDLQVVVLTHKTNEWEAYQIDSHYGKYLRALHAWYDGNAARTIKSLMKMAESRRESGQGGPAILLILDDLNFIEELNYEAQFNIHWLLAYGAQVNIWVLGAINTGFAKAFRYWMELFRTRIVGCVRNKKKLENLTLVPGLQMKPLDPASFRVWTGTDWLTYQLPLLGD